MVHISTEPGFHALGDTCLQKKGEVLLQEGRPERPELLKLI
ncbi:Uncharacterized protein dnm_050470 [Desulfonema magnum]|uniref:Uncharacterized protein n=1 Tax=Desulfonema magnum TaxID=45655 RepID=A0A975BNW7_9BACT|nr:Uncharacterized protein dnm_050470 [Desulfonema magnum]